MPASGVWATEGWLGAFGNREGSGSGDSLRGSRCSKCMSLALDGPGFKSQQLCCVTLASFLPS